MLQAGVIEKRLPMTRKYGQRGYMEGERDRRDAPRGGSAGAPREPPPPRHNLDRPRGRGLGAPTEEVFRCAVCGGAQPPPSAEAFEAGCEKCGADLHTCTHCTSFDTSAPWECRRWQERQALDPGAAGKPGPVLKKSKRNDCPLFAAKVSLQQPQEQAPKADPDDPRAAFDALFKL